LSNATILNLAMVQAVDKSRLSLIQWSWWMWQ